MTGGALRPSDALAGVEDELADVEVALTRLDDGTYGRCETCGQALPDERLAVSPATRRCGGHLDFDRS